ncbi:hypothetical protein Hanom_Chr14g01277541 [Helianthus anomalus]
MIYYLRCAKQGRFLEGHGPGKIFGRSANFSHFNRNFYIYYVWPGLTRTFLVPVSFGSGTFIGQDPPLVLRYDLYNFAYLISYCTYFLASYL